MSYPSKTHCQSTAARLPKPSGKAAFYLLGDVHQARHDTDADLPFRQESNFLYLSGAEDAGFQLIYDLNQSTLTLFAPVRPADESATDLTSYLDSEAFDTIHALPKTSLDALGPSHASKVNTDHLKDAITEARVLKNDKEISLLRYANKVSSDAHVALMRAAGKSSNERELDALFRYETARFGCRYQAYLPIVGSGTNAAILHYGQNEADMTSLKPGQMVLVDAGAEYHGYAADITRTWPIGGKFIGESRIIYEIVLAMQKAVLAELRPEVEWEDMHRLAFSVCLDGLISAGIVKEGISKEDAMANNIPAIFFPHGLGHLIGLDVHDVGGYPKGVERIDEPGLRYLRMRRTLKAGMVVTVEPGCYFVRHFLEPALKNPKQAAFLNADVIASFMDVGGVRLEDCVVITETGYDNLTTAPKEVSEVESLMA
ncbi:peptidase M24, structural domain-containing protein [Piptocephalis cylindrospora]|uniref:Peptidase M24, structural domain-containing protein n=1 Tax=Piptocephalis cylindrospora TaxID=1907219 RepID=A0A4P9Y6F8_9FUNG|nr:peptidase M24, structural domain-containing protein [Piptocephalis cylindrospora]|eukprot:RKP14362.1 peptidase M24, structural domain-containing protein [Piptocephalis cylindrospora]